MCMGTADIIPGISGGTIALILGIYSKLIDSIREIKIRSVLNFLRLLPFFFRQKKRQDLIASAFKLELPFLMPLFMGIISAIFFSSKFIPNLLKDYPSQANGLFFGLILASSYVPFSMIKRANSANIITLVLFAVLAFFVVGLGVAETGHGLATLFGAGALAVSAMILPGVSGSYILAALGQYEFILTKLHQAILLSPDALLVILVFISGLIFGLLSFVRILHWLLHKYHRLTLSALTGLMIGGLRAVWPFKTPQGGLEFPAHIGKIEAQSLALLGLGIIITVSLIYFGRRKHGLAIFDNNVNGI